MPPCSRPWACSTAWGSSPIRPGMVPASPWRPKDCPSGSDCPAALVGRLAMPNDIEVFIDFAPGLKRVGTLHRHSRRGNETTSFEYHADWLGEPAHFSPEPALALNPR